MLLALSIQCSEGSIPIWSNFKVHEFNLCNVPMNPLRFDPILGSQEKEEIIAPAASGFHMFHQVFWGTREWKLRTHRRLIYKQEAYTRI